MKNISKYKVDKGVLIPMILILSSLIGLDGIFIAVPIADLTAFLITIFLFIKSIRKIKIN